MVVEVCYVTKKKIFKREAVSLLNQSDVSLKQVADYETSGVSSVTQSGEDVSYALGFEFDHGLKDRIVYRFMGAHHQVGDDEYDVNSASAAVIYRFP